MNQLFPELESYVNELKLGFPTISEERRELCLSLSERISEQVSKHGHATLIFICTHNSRRSHLAQIWASISAYYYDKNVICYSGGTEETAVYPSVLKSLESAGLDHSSISEGTNPVHSLTYSENNYPLSIVSKKFDHPTNPQEHYGAIMTCGHAEENCPFIPEAEFRFPMTYTDPKHSDGSAEEQQVYEETCKLIATELFFIMSRV